MGRVRPTHLEKTEVLAGLYTVALPDPILSPEVYHRPHFSGQNGRASVSPNEVSLPPTRPKSAWKVSSLYSVAGSTNVTNPTARKAGIALGSLPADVSVELRLLPQRREPQSTRGTTEIHPSIASQQACVANQALTISLRERCTPGVNPSGMSTKSRRKRTLRSFCAPDTKSRRPVRLSMSSLQPYCLLDFSHKCLFGGLHYRISKRPGH